jgi:hypothetical protein
MARERRLASYKPGTYGNCAVLLPDYDPHGFGETLEYEGVIATITPTWTTLTFADGETLRLSTKRNKSAQLYPDMTLEAVRAERRLNRIVHSSPAMVIDGHDADVYHAYANNDGR